MSAAESKKADGPKALSESEYEATTMTYGPGKVPLYVVALWAVVLIGLAVYFISYGMPDLSAWGSP